MGACGSLNNSREREAYLVVSALNSESMAQQQLAKGEWRVIRRWIGEERFLNVEEELVLASCAELLGALISLAGRLAWGLRRFRPSAPWQILPIWQ